MINPTIVLREEFDDYAVLYNPDNGEVYGLNPTGVFIWKLIDGKHTVEDIGKELNETYEKVPEESITHLGEFINNLVKRGLIGYES